MRDEENEIKSKPGAWEAGGLGASPSQKGRGGRGQIQSQASCHGP
jgi:hypothetical protein